MREKYYIWNPATCSYENCKYLASIIENIKNCICHHFNDITKVEDIDLDNILIEEKSYENILVDKILYKNLIGAKNLHIRFHKIDGTIIVNDGTRYLALLGSEEYDFI